MKIFTEIKQYTSLPKIAGVKKWFNQIFSKIATKTNSCCYEKERANKIFS